MKHNLLLSACLLVAANAAYADTPVKTAVPSREIPIEQVMTHDPVLARQGDRFYLFATGEGVSVMSSSDLKTWKFEKPVFEEAPILFITTACITFFILVRLLPKILRLSAMPLILRSTLLMHGLNGRIKEKSSSLYPTGICGMPSTLISL